jgi:hypothetical protein
MTEELKNHLMTTAAPIADSFSGYVDTYEGDDGEDAVNQSLIEGARVKFSGDGRWTDVKNVELPANLILLVVNVIRAINHWVDGKPSEKSYILKPGERWPNIKKKNEDAPQSEWRINPNNGQLEGPWQAQRLLYLADPNSGDKYTYPTHTEGGRRAISELSDKITWAQRIRPGVRPLVTFSKVWMPTKFKGRDRPHFVVQKEWMLPDGTLCTLLQPQTTQKAIGAAAQLDAFAGTSTATQQPEKAGQQPPRQDDMSSDSIPF